LKPIRTYNVRPKLPERIGRLLEIAQSFWYEWDYDALSLFLRLDRDLWETSGHNPIRMLGLIGQDNLEAIAADDGFLAQYDRVCEVWDGYLREPAWFDGVENVPDEMRVAYFSFEFGLSECLPIYSGGLGVLSGDHVKACSDLGLPVIGVGLLYQQGYFRQYLNNDGWQGEHYPNNDFYTMPVRLERTRDGRPLLIQVEYPSGPVKAQVWRVKVGRACLIMLDTNIPSNSRQEDRAITDQVYGGNIENRIRQEVLLGVGGLRALEALKLRPTVCHLNEGHSAFLTLERIRQGMEENGLTFEEARETACAANVFTTHTPVAAGNEIFPAALVERYARALFGALEVPYGAILGLGRAHPQQHSEGFGMTVFAINMSSHVNAVSRLHGRVSREMWKDLWPQTPVEEAPISSITNGVHLPTWVSHDLNDLFERYLDPEWRREMPNTAMWRRIQSIPNEELWRTHERRREKLVSFARRHLIETLMKRRATPREIAAAEEVLDPAALTIVFARRMATYKRGALLLRDLERLARLISDPERPVQFLFSGKAHPHDNPGKDVIREIAHVATQDRFRQHLIFLEDYDLQIARYLVQGADVWLNTPRRPLEASGTSGMKAAANGALNVSILDGWYDEAHREHPEIGWAIGAGEVYDDHDYQDRVECAALYNILEQEVIPMFYNRGRDDVPREWVQRMKAAMMVSCSIFNTCRMTRHYAERFYFPAARRHEEFAADGCRRAKQLAQWRARMKEHWGKIRVENIVTDQPNEIGVGERFNVRARVHLAPLTPDDVLVEIYQGEIDAANELQNARRIEMKCDGPAKAAGDGTGAGTVADGTYNFIATIEAGASGHFGYSIRVLPKHKDLVSPFVPGLIVWAGAHS